MNFHKRCVFKIPNDCSYSKKRRRSSFVGSLSGSTISLVSTSSVGATSTDGAFLLPPGATATRDGSLSPTPSKKNSVFAGNYTNYLINYLICNYYPLIGRPAAVEVLMANRLKIPHTFVIHTYTKPTQCHLCKKMLVGVFKQVKELFILISPRAIF